MPKKGEQNCTDIRKDIMSVAPKKSAPDQCRVPHPMVCRRCRYLTTLTALLTYMAHVTNTVLEPFNPLQFDIVENRKDLAAPDEADA